MTTSKDKIVCFGETLWDVLPDGAMPGGAPMNVAYHLNKLGNTPQLITRVGHDEWGKRLIQLMEHNDISTEFFQMDHELPTGKVIANISDSTNVSYHIVAPVAWDRIDWEDSFVQLMADCEYFVFGSLCTRNETSKKTLFRLLESATKKVLDINLRPPFIRKETIQDLLHTTDILKLNNDELELLTGWFSTYQSDEDRVRVLQDRFDIPVIVVTKGKEGSLIVSDGHIIAHPGFEVSVSDTIGSGDAFLAGFLSCISAGKPLEYSIEYANALGALVATYTGACPRYDKEEVWQLAGKIPKEQLPNQYHR